MKVIELTISKSRKYNLGNYQSRDVFAALKVEIESCDIIEEVATAVTKQLDDILLDELKDYRDPEDVRYNGGKTK